MGLRTAGKVSFRKYGFDIVSSERLLLRCCSFGFEQGDNLQCQFLETLFNSMNIGDPWNSEEYVRRIPSCGIWSRAVLVRSDVSEEISSPLSE
jgi:hypothetical protein